MRQGRASLRGRARAEEVDPRAKSRILGAAPAAGAAHLPAAKRESEIDDLKSTGRTCSLFIFAGGGTGGHLYPGLAVADELAALDREATIVFACSTRAIDRRILDPLSYAIVPQPVQPLPNRPGKVWAFARAWLASKAQACRMTADLKPRAVLGLGGFAAAPLIRAAAKAGVPTALLNPDAVPGRANRYLARRVDVIFTQFDETAERFAPALRSKIRACGCPIRAGMASADRAEGAAHFGLDPRRKTLLVCGGSLGAEALNEAVASLVAGPLAEHLADRWQVLHITGASRGGVSAGGGGHVHGLAYCRRMDLALAAADLAVVRGGASTIAELTATATPAVIVPYPHHKDRQQYLNAQPLARAGAAAVCEQTAAPLAGALGKTLAEILGDPRRLAEMREAALPMGKGGAAREIARWLVGAAG